MTADRVTLTEVGWFAWHRDWISAVLFVVTLYAMRRASYWLDIWRK